MGSYVPSICDLFPARSPPELTGVLRSGKLKELHPLECASRGVCDGRLAQLVRAPALQAGGRRFESCTAHQIRHRTVIMVMSPESRARRFPRRGTAIRASGVVVQLVRTLPCHGRGRGFGSRRPRHHSKALMEWWPENPDPQSSPQSLDSIGLHPQLRQERSLRGLCFLPVLLRVEI